MFKLNTPAVTVCLALSLVAAAAWAEDAPKGAMELHLLGDTSNAQGKQLSFADLKSMKKSGDKVTMWKVALFGVAQPADGGKKVSGVWTQMNIDCKAKTIKGGSAEVMDDALTSLMKGDSGDTSRPVKAGTMDAVITDYACDGKDPYPTVKALTTLETARAEAMAIAAGPAPK